MSEKENIFSEENNAENLFNGEFKTDGALRETVGESNGKTAESSENIPSEFGTSDSVKEKISENMPSDGETADFAETETSGNTFQYGSEFTPNGYDAPSETTGEIPENNFNINAQPKNYGFDNGVYRNQTSVSSAKPNKPPKKNKSFVALWVVTAFCLVVSLCSAVISVSGLVSGKPGNFVYPETKTPDYQTAISQSTDLLTVAGVAEKMDKSVILITAEVSNGYQSGTSMGSGFFITAEGIAVTNHHVIENARSVKVKTSDGTEYSAEVLGSDSTTDVAVIKVNGSGFQPAELGDSTKTKVGDQVVAIGTPYDPSLQNTVTSGYISAVRDDYRFSSLSRVLDVFQHDAAINSGNSGGPLCNMYGQVIGINSVKVSSETYENIGFAIQISSVSSIITELINNGSIDRPMIGITASTDTSVGGALVAAVAKGSPAETAGLQPGDIITKVDGIRVTSTEELINYFSKKNVGDVVELDLIRDAEGIKLKMTLFSTKDYNSLEGAGDSSQNPNPDEGNQNPEAPEYPNNGNSGGGNGYGDFFDRFFN